MPAVVITMEAACVDNAILLDYLTSEVAYYKPVIGITDRNILIDNYCSNDELDFWMPGGSSDCQDERDESDDFDAIGNASRRR